MKILKESYTKDEIIAKVTDARGALYTAIDELYVLASSLEDPTQKDETHQKLARYVNSYIRQVEEIISDFTDDFEDLINNSEEGAKGEPTQEDIVNWLAEHDQAWEDACDWFGVDDLSGVDYDELISWIFEHDVLSDDLMRHFGKEYFI